MSKSTWGFCKTCKWWQVDIRAAIKNETLGMCIDEKILPFRMLVSGASGCNRYMKGEPAHAGGSSSAPPTAKPIR